MSQTGKAFAVSVLVLIPAVIVFLAAGLSGTRDHIHGNQGIERQKREDLSMKKIKLIKILAGFCPDAFVYFSVQGGRFGECSTGRDKNSSESGDHAWR